MNKFNNSVSPKELFQKLDKYYQNNSLYEDIHANAYLTKTWMEDIKPLRTVVNRSVEFYVSKVIPGELSKVKIAANNQNVEKAIEQVWLWSNFSSQKQVAVRNLALYGNLFWKVISDSEKVYFEIIEPEFVTDFETDTRGYITEIRLDIPIVVDGRNLTHTEYWTKEEGYYSIWEHNQGEADLDQLGNPKETGFLEELGIDFIPFVLSKFRDVGEKWGAGCTKHALEKIDEANRESTRLAQLLFRYNKPTMVVSANDKDSNGRPIPAPKLSSSETDLKDSSILYLPGVSTINSLVPQIDYASALNILKDMMEEIENDLPELRYYSLKDTQLSGKALRLILAGAVDRAEEARGNFIQGLIRLNQMAITIGSFWNLFQVGKYENGDYEHSIVAPDLFAASLEERALIVKEFVSAGLPLASALKFAGFSEEEIADTLQAKANERLEQDNALAQSLQKFNGE